MKSVLLMIALIFFALLIAACSPDGSIINSVPLDDPAKSINSPVDQIKTDQIRIDQIKESAKPILVTGPQTCGGSLCASNQECVDEKCVCDGSSKQCGQACVSKESCCSDSDCQGTEQCADGKCVFTCSRVICQANQVCDESQKRCICPPDYKFCSSQSKCIPVDYCCDRFDCGRDSVCTQTVYSARVCLNTKQPFCKYLGDKVTKSIAVNNVTFDVTAAEFIYGGKVKVVVDGRAFVMENGSKQKLVDGLTLSVDDVRELGGKCRAIDEYI